MLALGRPRSWNDLRRGSESDDAKYIAASSSGISKSSGEFPQSRRPDISAQRNVIRY